MSRMVTLTIDGRTLSVQEGMLVVDAAKMAGINIPVFCYHPKMEPVGMCRMCLVEVGRPVVDRATGLLQTNPDGSPKISFGPKLDTACTTPVSDGMVVLTNTEKVEVARREMLEFLLTSHPLDCPVCDKGGECPLQNLTMAFGPSKSRFLLDEKQHNDKHVALGDLIWLDRERCIQCSRCVRFQDKVAGDPVIGFYQRGRRLEIVTHSEPGFDSVFSGNTSDICPVGALTTADFRFGARAWEMKSAASICPHCPVGCNLTMNIRREAAAGGRTVIKRAMPRQNEAVNEIWLCDKGRFAYQFAESAQRLSVPMVRKAGTLVPVSWEEALQKAADGLGMALSNLVVLAGGRLSNEDLFNLKKFAEARGAQALLDSRMAGGDQAAACGLTPGSNLSSLGKGSAILVVASDLHEEAPLWWLRVKQAAQRGAALIVCSTRPTRLDAFASCVLRCAPGGEVKTIAELASAQAEGLPADLKQAAQAFATAENGVILMGCEGLDLETSSALASVCARLLVNTHHAGRLNNGLIPVWPQANTQGAWEMGFRPTGDLAATLESARSVYIAASDPVGDHPALAKSLEAAGFVVVQELFLTETARLADVVLPSQSLIEREGSFTSGERRVQRYYQVELPTNGSRSDYVMTAQLARRLGIQLEERSAALVMSQMASELPAFSGISYPKLAEVAEQLPQMSRRDVYYGGTSYENRHGTGVPLAQMEGNEAGAGVALSLRPAVVLEPGEFWLLPVTRLYDRGITVRSSALLGPRLAQPAFYMNSTTAASVILQEGQAAKISGAGFELEGTAAFDETLPDQFILAPWSTGLSLPTAQKVRLKPASK